MCLHGRRQRWRQGGGLRGLPERPSGSQIATEHQVQSDLKSTQSRKQRQTLAPKALITYAQAAGSSSPGEVESMGGATKDITEADNYSEPPLPTADKPHLHQLPWRGILHTLF